MTTNPRRAGFIAGIVLASVTVFMLLGPFSETWLNAGPANTGHASLVCADCHINAAGSTRQQLQGKVHFWVGLRADDVSLGHHDISNQTCIACHARAHDDHPVSRFAEEQFAAARKTLSADSCMGCHEEHTRVRVSMPATGCQQCHSSLQVKNDPLDISHASLIKQGRWDSCLGCHDFHGNHIRQTQTRLSDAFPIDTIEIYLKGGPSPYGEQRRFTARKKGQ